MFFDRQFQAKQNEWVGTSTKLDKKKKKSLLVEIFNKAKGHLVVFLDTSSIHGLNHLVSLHRHPFEVSLWLIVMCMSVFGSVFLSRTTWFRYQYSPTVISMDRDMFAWNTTFPCVTICPSRKVDRKKLLAYLMESPETDKDKLENFITALGNASFQNFNMIPDYSGISPDNYMELLLNLSMNFKPFLTIGASGIILDIEPTITEMGKCFSINSRVAGYNSPQYRISNRWDKIKHNDNTFFVHPLDGEVFAQVINLSTPYDVYIHGPLEVPDIATKYRHSAEEFYMKLYFTATTVYTSPQAAELSVAQRKCRFHYENNLPHNAIYTYNMCRMECRIRICLRYCNCIPHFYRRIGNEKICDVKGLHCLHKYQEELFQLKSTNLIKVNCDCVPNCDDVTYVIQSYVLQEWFLGTNLQWGVVTYPRMRYRRDIIFGFTDVLVAVGSMAGLFLGCSVLSFMEIIYFLTLRLFWYLRGK